MGISGFGGYVLATCAATAIFAGCGGSQPIGAPGTLPQSRVVSKHSAHGRSWMQPGAKKADLLYITYPNSGSVGVYSYPGLQAVGALNAFIEPTSECADKAGNGYIVDGSNHVVDEYAHGGRGRTEFRVNVPALPRKRGSEIGAA
jgi:hypothetical protein